MKITKLEYQNHKIFGNLTIDLSNKGVSNYNKIVIVGENGSGKTTFLNDLYSFLSTKKLEFSKIYYIGDNNEELIVESNNDSKNLPGAHNIIEDGVVITNNSCFSFNRELIKDNAIDLRKNGVAYSKVQVDFKTNKITNIGSSDINKEEYNNDNYDFNKIKQLLVDLYYQDAVSFSNMNDKETIGKEEFDKKYSKIHKFKNAINNFFDDLNFEKIEKREDRQEIIFEKSGKEIFIDDLSTGEKQIVFRGVFILKDIDIHGNGFVLIDEPEISMHPKWEDKIFKYYSDLLFSNQNSIGQLFIATHSERILKQVLSDKDSLLIEFKNNSGVIECKRYDSPLVLPYKSDAEINFKIFNIYSNDFHLQLYDFIQQNFVQKKLITEVDKFIENYNDPGFYDKNIHGKQTSYKNFKYETICTSIRNDLHHGNPNSFSLDELKLSTNLMYKICEDLEAKGNL